ncbi:MAG: ATP synthase subunit delta [Candidatus Daviesbacteria bacterium GW2011_GWA2_38_24]|uniref:ATP synthase subunit delta n=1 Tax=Candidatus Daviesbacteria bacterium GW2011_GWA2_38_24 TaxID=1618422 RepID=A0A0G0JFJ9_9BACT|nr:MAG: ATP synthase subunit delta [Candidatus Daviesbacteria bacterium GW2011_GWA2_38_24]KKQ78669.1 MAG: ATP synthase subunit delta [Candidatus Daviesbacteria bacterium GW2011_GWA1_38_7]OGE24237.1 MAG: hypothetical protein A2688_02710 [Candidatus Daviesbacteria bacterium RIFCSPHIGHO2_01_FULL_38_8]
MKKYKNITALVNKAIKASLIDGQVDEKNVLDAVASFSKFSIGERLFALKEYLKILKREIDSKTLVIESPVNLSDEQVEKIKSKFIDFKYQILETKLKINPSLFGGLRFRIGDVIYDDTIRHKINQIGGVIRG